MGALRFSHGGETVEVDIEKLALHEGFALQKATGFNVMALVNKVQEGDFEALAALAWVILKFRMGHADVTLEDICEGRFPVSLGAFEPVADQVPPTGANAKVKTPS